MNDDGAWVIYFDEAWCGFGPMALAAAQAAKTSLRGDGFAAYAVPHREAVELVDSTDADQHPSEIYDGDKLVAWSGV